MHIGGHGKSAAGAGRDPAGIEVSLGHSVSGCPTVFPADVTLEVADRAMLSDLVHRYAAG
ncbi:hypothetical protein [Mycobacterium sp.]|uniref:hypothetical protein n=1 Tax=Mycobacterium sp. TaxID=1785 RepID=UPI0031E17FFA